MTEWEIFYTGFASGFMAGFGTAILLRCYVRRIERRVLDELSAPPPKKIGDDQRDDET